MSQMITLSPGILTALIDLIPAADTGSFPGEDAALIARVGTALAAARGWPAVIEHVTETSANTTSMKLFGMEAMFSEESSVEKTVRALRSDPPNRHAAITAEVLGVDPTREQKFAYSLNAEARLVDGTLYVTAERAQHRGPTQGDLPAGWVVVEAPDAWPALDKVGLAALAAGSDPLAALGVTLALDPAVGTESGTLDDGTPVEIITIDLAGAALKDAMRQLLEASAAASGPGTDVAMSQALIGQLDPDSAVTITVSLDAVGDLVARSARGRFSWTQMDMQAVNPDIPPGTVFDSRGDFAASVRTERPATPPEPTAAPPVAAS
jgi:hypothetical protein